MSKQKIVVVGQGGMGKLFATIFSSKLNEITYAGRDVTSANLVDADVIVIATPTDAAQKLSTLLQNIPGLDNKLVICLWSYIKTGEDSFASLTAPIIYVHFLFGPDIENLTGQNIIVAGEYKHTLFTPYMRRMKEKNARVHLTTPEVHDKTMAYTQSLSQLSSIVLGISLARSGYTRKHLHDFASLTFRLNRHTIERIMTQKAGLWAELQFENQYYPDILNQYINDLQEIIRSIENKDEQAFTALFTIASEFWQQSFKSPEYEISINQNASRFDGSQYDLVALGPAGTYSHEAAKKYAPKKASLFLADSIQQVISFVKKGEIKKGIVPIENSIHGVVVESLDTIYSQKIYIEDEIILDIHHVLCALERPQQKETIKVIYSHPQALGQCREYLAREYPNAIQIPTVSTAAAMQKIVDQKDLSALAIGPEFAAKLYNLPVLDRDIQDVSGNQTRFVVVSKDSQSTSKLHFTQIVIVPKVDRPGLLYDILSIIKEEGVNMSQIESRPDRTKLGSYIFYVRLDAPSSDIRYKAIETKLKAINVGVRRLTT